MSTPTATEPVTTGAVGPERAARWRRGLVLVVAGIVLVQGVSPRTGGADEAEVEAARQEAREASIAFSNTETRLGELDVEIARTQASIRVTLVKFETLRSILAEEAIQQYVRAGAGEVPLVSADINVQARASALSRAARGQATSRADDLAAVKVRLEREQADLSRQQADAEHTRLVQRERRTALYNRLEELQAIEARRLENERLAEQARRQAAAEAEAFAAEAAYQASRTDNSPSAPVPSRPVVPASWLCPITGAYVFSDTWGEYRSYGRSHKGTDMFAGYGTPLVAVVGGEAINYGWSYAGGYDVFLLGDDGNRYYYAHLDGYPTEGRVEQGDVIGYVGDTGNASGVPHLHFEIHPGGGGWTNPYSTLVRYC